MKNIDLSIFRKFDWIVVIAMFFLITLSLIVLFPISLNENSEHIFASHFFKQAVFAAVGVALYLFFLFFDYQFLKKYSTLIFLSGLILLSFVLFAGKTVRGTEGWIRLGNFNLQVVEPFKLAIVIILAKYFSLNSRTISNSTHVLITAVLIGGSVWLVLKQPDLGSALVIIAIWLGMLLVSGVKKRYLALIVFFGVLTIVFSWFFLFKNYQKDRITSMLNPMKDPRGSAYNLIQSTVAVGSGGIKGKGLGHGSQSQLNFLPEKHTDFIFAVVAEELGFIGSLFLISILSILVFRLIKIAQNARDNFGKLFVSGIAVIILVQSFINIGMNVGLVPITGIPLPFLSYGGSALITLMIAMGMVGNLSLIHI